MKTIVTHGANFHPDDLFATATIMLVLQSESERYKLTRIQKFLPESWAHADYVLDVGLVYAPKNNRFDHHQEGGAGKRENGILYATFGLVWKKFGKKLAGSQELADYVDRKLVQPLDAEDNGVTLYDKLNYEKVSPIILQDYIYLTCDKAGVKARESGKMSAFDPAFKKLLPMAKEIILAMIERAKRKVEMKKKALQALKKAKDKRVIISDEYIGFDFSDLPEPLITVYPDGRTKGYWCAKTIKKSDRVDAFEARMYFPKEWAGKGGEELAKVSGVSDAYFCHNGRFLVVAKSKEGILELVRKALDVL